MARGRSSLPPVSRLLAAALPFVLGATLVLLFDIIRPALHSCGDEAASSHGAVDAYRSGAVLLHLLTVSTALGALAWLSARHGRGPLGVGWPTVVAAGVTVAAALAMLLPIDEAALYVLLPLIVIDIGIVLAARPLGAPVTAVLAATLLGVAAAWAGRTVARGRTVAVQAALWALVVMTGAHLLLVYLQGDPPAFC